MLKRNISKEVEKDTTLPLPYAAYTSRQKEQYYSFEKYKYEIVESVRKSTLTRDSGSTKELIKKAYAFVNPINYPILDWMIDNIDKIRYVNDFSHIIMGVQADERSEKVHIRNPYTCQNIYPNFNLEEFLHLNTIEKLEWMYENCEFIPFRIKYEVIDVSNKSFSYKYSHIKRDEKIMKLLDEYLKTTTDYILADHYYYIKFSDKSSSFYLEEDKGHGYVE